VNAPIYKYVYKSKYISIFVMQMLPNEKCVIGFDLQTRKHRPLIVIGQ